MLDSCLQMLKEYDMLPPGTKVLCAVSGGADSICLLYQLALLRPYWGFELAAAHFDHRLRGAESDRDAAFVASFIKTCCGPVRRAMPDGSVLELPGVELVVGHGDVAARARRTGRGLEETARQMRYAFLNDTADRLGCDRIATAHTADDDLETFLLHLLRGSGLRGLTGIAPVRGRLIRPMLTTTRAQVEDFLRLFGFPFMTDSSNFDDTYTRNRLRHQVIPVLTSVQPEFGRRLTATMDLLREDEDCLSALARQVSAQAVPCPGGLSIDAGAVAAQPDPIAARAVRQLIGRLSDGNDDCSAVHLRGTVALCRGSSPSARLDLPNGLTARRAYDRLELVRETSRPALEPVELPLPGRVQAGQFRLEIRQEHYDGSPHRPCSFALSVQKTQKGLTARPRHTGDELARQGRPRSSVKKLMIGEKLPRRLRDAVPILDCAGQVAAVAGLGPDAAFLPQKGELCWRVICTPLWGTARHRKNI